MSRDVKELDADIAKLKEKRKIALEKKEKEVGKFLIKEWGLKHKSTDEIKELIRLKKYDG